MTNLNDFSGNFFGNRFLWQSQPIFWQMASNCWMISFSIQKAVKMAESQWDETELSFLSESGDTAIGTTSQIKEDEHKDEGGDDEGEKEQPKKEKIGEEKYEREEEDGESSENDGSENNK
ncbi:MAG: hypothetical protein GY820_46755 [Gammaproteobacteria bacterium]|nr:hypothetical protein [Gammaproteobacteria bacterium]